MKLLLFISLLVITNISIGQSDSTLVIAVDTTATQIDSLAFKPISSVEQVYSDSIMFKNGDHIVGKVKELDRGVLTLKTKYSDSDFKIKWLNVTEFYSNKRYMIYLNSDQNLFGVIEMDTSDKEVVYIRQDNGLRRPVIFKDIIYIKRIDKKFWDRIKASIDAGYTWTKANNAHQISIKAKIAYYGKYVYFATGTNIVRSIQDSTANIKRTEGDFAFRVYMPRDFFFFLKNDLLSNTEQLLELRSNTSTGFGYHFVNSNRMVGSIGLGIAWNNENFSNDSINWNSLEGLLGVTYQIFNLGDLDASTSVTTYPSLTNLGRIRIDFKIDVRYKFPFDLYIGVGYTLNYDNRPTTDASKSDFVFQTSIGWSW